VEAIRSVWPEELPLFVRLSVTDWLEGSREEEDSLRAARLLKERQVDVIDCSSGGLSPAQQVPFATGYQTRFATLIREQAAILTGAVGLITAAQQADHIITTGQADLVLLAREFLRDPYFPLHAGPIIHQGVTWPKQYQRAAPRS